MSNTPFLFVPTFSWPAAPFGLLYTYEAGSTTPKTTYSDNAGANPLTNPVELDATGSATIRLGAGTYKFVLLDQTNTVTLWTQDDYDPALQLSDVTNVINEAYVAAFIWPQTTAEAAAGVTPTSLQYPTQPYDIRRYGALLNNVNIDTAALNQGLSVASQTVNGAFGSAISIPIGTSILNAEIPLPNRARVLGLNKRGSYFLASGAWNATTSPWMFHAVNGTSSMFDSTLENLTVDCNGITGLGGILSDAWQDDCGLRGVLVNNFVTSGIKFQNGYGGADYCKIVDTEFFGNSIGGGSANGIGIDLTSPMGITASFKLDVQGTVITGGTQNLASGISLATNSQPSGNSLMCRGVHFEACNIGIICDGNGFIDLENVDGASNVTTLVQINAGFTGTLIMRNCRRNGSTNFLVDNRIGQIVQFGAITGGSLYTTGVYMNVALTGGSGSGATANITVAGGAVTAVILQNPGTNYAVADSLSASVGNIGGTGSGFSIPVYQTFTGYGTIAGYDHPLFISKSDIVEGAKSLATASAWCYFNGSTTGTNAPLASYNVLNVIRNSAGNYTVTLVRPMMSGNAAAVAMCNAVTSGISIATQLLSPTTFKVLISVSGTPTDESEVKAVIFGG